MTSFGHAQCELCKGTAIIGIHDTGLHQRVSGGSISQAIAHRALSETSVRSGESEQGSLAYPCDIESVRDLELAQNLSIRPISTGV
jgi:hypothetical protein